jgi:opacity protein-like surface antigen
MTAHRIGMLMMALLFAHAGTAAGQSRIGGLAYVTYGPTVFDATDSFKAVTGTSTRSGLGLGGNITGLWRGVFVDVGLSRQKLTGQRVFIDGGTVYPLGVPVTVTMRPLDMAAGWRFAVDRGRVSPYVGAGMTIIAYEETSAFALDGDEVRENEAGALVLAGVDIAVWRWVQLGGDVRYRAVTGGLGLGGVSQVFDEDQLGGLSAALRFSVGR